MPTPEDAPTAALVQKILPEMLKIAGEEGWNAMTLQKAAQLADVQADDVSQALPSGIDSLVPLYFRELDERLRDKLSNTDMGSLRIRDKVTLGVETWFELLGEHHGASVKAIDWCSARLFGRLPTTELIWGTADTIWTGIGDEDTGFTYMSKRTTLSAVLTSTLAVWRQNANDDAEWKAFLSRRIDDVMSFEKFKAKLKAPKFPFFA